MHQKGQVQPISWTWPIALKWGPSLWP